MQDPVPLSLASEVSASVLAIPGVAGFHSGPYGEVALLYPGARLPGLRLTDGHLELHVVLDLQALGTNTPLSAVARQIRHAAQHHSPFPVDVIFADATSPVLVDQPRNTP